MNLSITLKFPFPCTLLVSSSSILASLSPSCDEPGDPDPLEISVALVLPLLIPLFLAGRLYVQLTSKSTQFWQRATFSTLGLHLMLRL